MTIKAEKECFAIMPIADIEGYPDGHFLHVYQDIVAPACVAAGYKAIRADEVKQTNMIHLDILKKLIDAPIAICDLSTRNPNVLFELGIRQAFDKPVVLIQEKGTEKIFDIAPLRYLEYSQDMKYHEVLKTQQDLKIAIEATVKADSEAGNVNSIVKLLALNAPASIPNIENGKEALAIEVLHAEMRDIRKMFEMMMVESRKFSGRSSISAVEFERLSSALEKLQSTARMSNEEKHKNLQRIMRDIDEMMMRSDEKGEARHFYSLMDRAQRLMSEIS